MQNDPNYSAGIDPIRIVKLNDLLREVQVFLSAQGVSSDTVFTLDNRRLYSAKQAGVKIYSIWATLEDLFCINL